MNTVGNSPLNVVFSPERGTWKSIDFPAHSLSVVLRGNCRSIIRTGKKSREFFFSPGSFFSLPAGEHWDSLEAYGAVTSITISLDPTAVAGEPLEMLKAPWFRDAQTIFLVKMLLRSNQQIQGSGIFHEETELALILRLARLAREVGGHRDFFGRPLLSLKKQLQVIDYIQCHLEDDLSIQAISTEAALSASQFALSFRHTFSRSVHQYILDARIFRAGELLRKTNLAIVEIASLCGFASQSHMTTAFGRATGLTPVTYRREFRISHFLGPRRSDSFVTSACNPIPQQPFAPPPP